MDLGKKFLAVALAILGTCAVSRAQFIGYMSSQSTAQVVFTNQAANATGNTLRNIGQSSHFVSVCNSLLSATITLEASTDGTFASPITIATANYGQSGFADNTCHVIQAGGYYPAVRVRIKNYSTGSTNVFYTGIGGPIATAPASLSTTGPSSPIACDQLEGPSSIPQNQATAFVITGLAGETVVVCTMTLSFSAATTTGTVTFVAGTGNTCTGPTTLYSLNITPGTQQVLHLTGELGGLFRTPQPGQTVCIATTAITAATLVDMTYAYITF